MLSQSPFCIEPTEEQRAILEKRARTHIAPYWEMVRAKIVLLAAEEVSNKEIAARLDTSAQVLSKWHKQFYEEGGRGLEDRPRSGRQTPDLFPPRPW